jgi:hypothetical protein
VILLQEYRARRPLLYQKCSDSSRVHIAECHALANEAFNKARTSKKPEAIETLTCDVYQILLAREKAMRK